MLQYNFVTILGGALVDLLVGDPPRLPHPVVGFGRIISLLERLLNKKNLPPLVLRLNGVLTVIIVLCIAFMVPFFLLKLLVPFPWIYWPVNIWLISTTIASKGLIQAGKNIYRLLLDGDVEKARQEVGMIVGRDTDQLTETEIIRATVETIAENTVDGVIAPICFGLVGGAPLAFLYRAINTLDSMIGYKNDRYYYFGWAAAKLDDLANLIPARFCAFMIFISAMVLKFDWKNSIKTTFQDAGKHPSPNGGWPEGAIAGALRVQLGGENFYQGVRSFRNYLGHPIRPLELEDIRRTNRVLYITLFNTLMLLFLAVLISIGGF